LALVAELAIAATLSVDSVYLGRDYFNDNSVQRFFYFEIDKHF
jgi:hypothetical protein